MTNGGRQVQNEKKKKKLSLTPQLVLFDERSGNEKKGGSVGWKKGNNYIRGIVKKKKKIGSYPLFSIQTDKKGEKRVAGGEGNKCPVTGSSQKGPHPNLDKGGNENKWQSQHQPSHRQQPARGAHQQKGSGGESRKTKVWVKKYNQNPRVAFPKMSLFEVSRLAPGILSNEEMH